MVDENAILTAEKAYREHIEGRPMVHAVQAYLASARPAMGDDVVRQALEFYANADYEGTGFWDGISCPGILFDKGRTAKAVLESSRPAMGDDVKLREALIQILDDGQFIVGYNDDDTPIFTTDEKRLTNGGSFCGGAGQQAISALATIPAGAPAPADEAVAIRYGWDGHGYQYIDNASGSDWQTRHIDGEPLYVHPSARADEAVEILLMNLKHKMNDAIRWLKAGQPAEVLQICEEALAALNQQKPEGE